MRQWKKIMRQMNDRVTVSLFTRFFYVWWTLGTAFFLYSTVFMGGGGAVEGKIADAHYFVAKGHFMEVSRAVFFIGAAFEILWGAATAALVVLYAVLAVQKQDPRWLESEWRASTKPDASG